MSTKHTPGPWVINDQYISDDHGTTICQWASYTDDPDASLIAAAPDLLASLKDLLAEIDSFKEIPANLSGATLTIARQRVARAEKQS